jgi:hypothetical protein
LVEPIENGDDSTTSLAAMSPTAEALGNLLRPRRIDVGRRHHTCPGQRLGNAADMILPNISGSNNSETYGHFCATYLRRQTLSRIFAMTHRPKPSRGPLKRRPGTECRIEFFIAAKQIVHPTAAGRHPSLPLTAEHLRSTSFPRDSGCPSGPNAIRLRFPR